MSFEYSLAPLAPYPMSRENLPRMTSLVLDGMATSLHLCLSFLWDAKIWNFRDRGYISSLPLALGEASLCLKMEPSPSSHYQPLLAL